MCPSGPIGIISLAGLSVQGNLARLGYPAWGGQEYRVGYLPSESDTGMFGGNSNWRGPIWMPVNALIIRSLLNYFLYYGDNFKIECPFRQPSTPLPVHQPRA